MTIGNLSFGYCESAGSPVEDFNTSSGATVVKTYRGPYHNRFSFISREIYSDFRLHQQYPNWGLSVEDISIIGDRKVTSGYNKENIYEDAIITAKFSTKQGNTPHTVYNENGDFNYEIEELDSDAINSPQEDTEKKFVSGVKRGLEFYDNYYNLTLSFPHQRQPNWTIIKRYIGKVNDRVIQFPSGMIALNGHCLFEGVNYTREVDTAAIFGGGNYGTPTYNITYTFIIRLNLSWHERPIVIRKNQITTQEWPETGAWKINSGNISSHTQGKEFKKIVRRPIDPLVHQVADLATIFAGEFYGILHSVDNEDLNDRNHILGRDRDNGATLFNSLSAHMLPSVKLNDDKNAYVPTTHSVMLNDFFTEAALQPDITHLSRYNARINAIRRSHEGIGSKQLAPYAPPVSYEDAGN